MCDERERLIGYVYDESDPLEQRRVEEHLESCATCREEISALRDVRQDLQSWRVPPHHTIWRPFVAVPVTPWWRQVPGWALAAAASVMFVAGAAGGAIVHAWLPASGEARVASTPDSGTANGVTAADLSEAERRIVQLMRDELGGIDQRVKLAARQTPAVTTVSDRSLVNEVHGLATSSDAQYRELIGLITSYSNDFSRVQSVNNERYQRIAREIQDLKAAAAAGGLQQNR
jgi:hypothetical protein